VSARRLLAALLGVGAAAVPLGAQDFTRAAVFTGFEMRSLSFDSGLGVQSISQVAVPLGVVLPLSRRITLDVGTRFARSTLEDDSGVASTLSGLTDLQARAVVQLVPDVALFTLTANLPTGKTELTADELLVTGAIASDLLPFPVSSYGSGTSVTTGLALAIPVAGFAVGLAGSYRYSSGYTPLADTAADYRTGGEARLRFGLDRLIGQGRLSLGFTYSSFATDEFGGNEVFQPGNRYITQGSLSIPIGNMGLSLYAWDLYRDQGDIPINGSVTEKQNVLALGAGASIQMGRNSLRPLVEYRRHTASDPGAGVASLEPAGTLLSLGLRYQMLLGERWSLLPGARFDTGNIVGDAGNDVAYRGFSVAVSMRATL
jgi:hypothetical protein